MNSACCLNCEKRYQGCHSSCKDYLQYKQKLAQIKERKKEEQERYLRSSKRRCFKK